MYPWQKYPFFVVSGEIFFPLFSHGVFFCRSGCASQLHKLNIPSTVASALTQIEQECTCSVPKVHMQCRLNVGWISFAMTTGGGLRLSPGIIWMDLDKIATKGFSSPENPPKSTLRNLLNFSFSYCRHLEEMHCHKKPFVAILSPGTGVSSLWKNHGNLENEKNFFQTWKNHGI